MRGPVRVNRELQHVQEWSLRLLCVYAATAAKVEPPAPIPVR